jgi:hypothetical protein
VENIGSENLDEMANLSMEILKRFDINPLLQISNIKIPKILSEQFSELELDDFKHINIDKILSLNIDWLKKLVYLQYENQLDELIEIVPKYLKNELIKLKNFVKNVSYENLVIAPLYYSKMLYYEELFFRVIENNSVYARGGEYKVDNQTSVGFAIYTDELLERVGKK